MPRCAACGEDNAPGAGRCSRCGASLASSPDEHTISVVVVDLVRTDPARAVASDDAAAVEARARRELRLLGGAVHDQGDHVALGVFGAPVARADAAERAVRAAVRVADAVEDLGAPTVGVQVAVHTGSYA